MNFRRTDSGVTNYNLFLKCDYVVFVEGGNKSITYDEVTRGDFNNISVDMAFWKQIFNLYEVKISYEIRAIGSKTTITSIAEGIVNGNIENTITAMDRDLDPYLGSPIYDSPFVLYTHGYSWENDTWIERVLLSLFVSLYPALILPEGLHAYIESKFNTFNKDSRRLIKADIIMAQCGETLINRNSGDELLAEKNGDLTFNKDRALQLIKQKNRTKQRKYHSIQALENIGSKDCYGKVIGAFGYRLLRIILKRYGIANTLPKDLASALVVQKLSIEFWDTSIRKHYDKQMAILQAHV